MSQPTRIPPRRKSRGDSQTLFSALILVIVFASLAGMYFYLEGQRKANEEVLNSIAEKVRVIEDKLSITCLLYTSPSPRDKRQSRMPSSA